MSQSDRIVGCSYVIADELAYDLEIDSDYKKCDYVNDHKFSVMVVVHYTNCLGVEDNLYNRLVCNKKTFIC